MLASAEGVRGSCFRPIDATSRPVENFFFLNARLVASPPRGGGTPHCLAGHRAAHKTWAGPLIGPQDGWLLVDAGARDDPIPPPPFRLSWQAISAPTCLLAQELTRIKPATTGLVPGDWSEGVGAIKRKSESRPAIEGPPISYACGGRRLATPPRNWTAHWQAMLWRSGLLLCSGLACGKDAPEEELAGNLISGDPDPPAKSLVNWQPWRPRGQTDNNYRHGKV